MSTRTAARRLCTLGAAGLIAATFGAGLPGSVGPTRAEATTPIPPTSSVDREIDRLQRAGAKLGKQVRSEAKRGASLDQQRDLIISGLRPLGVKASAARRIVTSHGKPGVALRVTTTPGASRLGGRALLAADTLWPKNRRTGQPLSLLAVLDLAALQTPSPLPPDGTLVLFWDASDPNSTTDLEGWMDPAANTEVRWLPPGTAATEQRAPAGAPSYPTQFLSGTPMFIVGGIIDHGFDYGTDGRGSAARAFEALLGLGTTAYARDQLLGASQDIQLPVLDEIGYWFKEVSNAATRGRYSADERRGKGWTLIAQISGAGSEEMMFGDAGNVSFAVPTVDLAARRFDRAVAIVQSG